MSTSREPDLKESHLDFTWKTHEYINNYVRFADQKAVFVVAWCSAIIGALYATHLHGAVFHSHLSVMDISWSTTCAGAALTLMGVSFLSAAWAVIPRLPTKQRAGLVFWESILVHPNGELFANDLGQCDQNALARHLCVQVHTLAEVARKKYRWLTLSMWLAFVGTTFGTLAILFQGCP
jgi:hypothetical protein